MYVAFVAFLLAGPTLIAMPVQALQCPYSYAYSFSFSHELHEADCSGLPFNTIIAFTHEDPTAGLLRLCVEPEDGSRPPTCAEACGLVKFDRVRGYRATLQILVLGPSVLAGCPASGGTMYLNFG